MAQREWQKTTKLIDAAIAVLRHEYPMTIRQTFYRLVSGLVIENCTRDYKLISRVMTIARRDGRVPYAWITDRSRHSYSYERGWSDVSDFAESFEWKLRAFRRDFWEDQPSYVEIWTEKDAIIGSITPVLQEFAVTAIAQRGFNSETFVHDIAERFAAKQELGKAVYAFYLGDWDPSGVAIESDVKRRVRTALDKLIDFNLQRVAIFKRDIREFSLPPLRVKMSDSRASKFLRKHGDRAVELDALPPTELRRRLRRHILACIDQTAWHRAQLVEDAQRQTCERYVGVFKTMAKRMQRDMEQS